MLKDFGKKIIVGLILALFMSYQVVQNLSYKNLIENLLDHSVTTINVGEVLELQAKKDLVFLDTRAAREYEVSHILNSRWVGYESFKVENVVDIPKNKLIIVYCSVGYRSEKIGEQLQKSGFQNVFNLYGGIFEWINQGQDVFRKGQKTDSIHVYNHYWGQWVKKGKKIVE